MTTILNVDIPREDLKTVIMSSTIKRFARRENNSLEPDSFVSTFSVVFDGHIPREEFSHIRSVTLTDEYGTYFISNLKETYGVYEDDVRTTITFFFHDLICVDN